MGEQKIVDARGLSCPQPAMLARQALQELSKGMLEVIVDTSTARENVSRIARNLGWQVSIEEQPEGTFRLVMKK
ncbi:MAG: sulfurtransferase TusA family protein [Chloroflexi bacterium]|nr:sulfurtransferase TusA family protein [Chloroflexota bacterium]